VAVLTEDLLVGDEYGTVYYYIVEWPPSWEVTRDTWPGTISLVAKISCHRQQICGLAWSPSGKLFASGGNDDLCFLFDVDTVLKRSVPTTQGGVQIPQGNTLQGGEATPESTNFVDESAISEEAYPAGQSSTESNGVASTSGTELQLVQTFAKMIPTLGQGVERHCWAHGAAVKAIAFCPWRESLIATGGGSHDKGIHFFHTKSGAALATIAVCAQVTSLTWSTTRKEIAAKFGYTHPEHPYRIAIFSWPDCRQVAAVPWENGMRALYAISYPIGPTDDRVSKTNKASQDGCLVIASSDKSVKFHEVWSRETKSMVGGAGVLGGSDILEYLEGIDKEGDVIR
jgi:meiosis-specific APC/C activator protein AMA1